VQLEIVRRFEFDHALQTMSVLVRDPTGEVYVFLKGSFEKVGSVCNAGTLPANYQKVHADEKLAAPLDADATTLFCAFAFSMAGGR
jgi:magnesium-transporting ATPase (P-type)